MIYALVTLLLMLFELMYFRVACRLGIADEPDLRSSHGATVLSGGGIVFLLGAWLHAAIFGMDYGWFLAGLTMIGAVSFADDVRPLSIGVRLVVQAVAMVLMFCQLGMLDPAHWCLVAVALVVCVGITNAFNFMDGINGMTGGYSLAVLLPLIYLNRQYEFISMPLLYVSGISLLVFCFFNFRKKARCFAGDVGSIAIAFILLFALGRLMLRTQDFAYIVFLAVYGADTVLTICHRIRLRENLGKAHRKHAYQLMANELKIPHAAVSLLYMALQLAVSFGMILCPINHYVYLGAAVALLSAAYVVFMKKNYYLHEEYLKNQQL